LADANGCGGFCRRQSNDTRRPYMLIRHVDFASLSRRGGLNAA
jgi:hypothetical protein